LPAKEAILVADPPGFTEADPIDWQLVWDKVAYEAAVRTAALHDPTAG